MKHADQAPPRRRLDQAPRRRLDQLLNRDFAEGYAEMRELIDFVAQRPGLSAETRGFARQLELMTVAAIEGINEAEEVNGVEPLTGLINLWHAAGCALAVANAQGFQLRGWRQVRRQMLVELKAAYDLTIAGMIDELQPPATRG